MGQNIGIGHAICPYCNEILHKHAPLTGKKKPVDEDVSFCASCGRVSLFDGENLKKVRECDLEEETRELIKKLRANWKVIKDAHVTGGTDGF